MSAYKIAGACTLCDAMCFTVLDLADDGSPKRLGPPLSGSTRIGFMLMDGTRMGLTFCQTCSGLLSGRHYVAIWQKVIRSWVREIGSKPRPAWFSKQFANGLLAEMGREPWEEIVRG